MVAHRFFGRLPRTEAPRVSKPKVDETKWGCFFARITTLPHSLRQSYQAWKVRNAIQFLQRHGKSAIGRLCEQRAAELALQLSIKGVQMILDQKGIAHCAYCHEHFSLKNLPNGGRICLKCEKRLAPQPVPIKNGQKTAKAAA